MAGWKLVTDAVHAKGGKIVIQLMHTGRVTHTDNLPGGAEVVAPTSAVCPGEMYTDKSGGMQPYSVPRQMTEADIQHAVDEYAQSAKLAIEAGFDGIELHAANGYLIEQFLNGNVNTRTDGWGESAEGRNRFALEVARATSAAIGADKVGIRLSPYGVFNGTGSFEGVDAQFKSLVEACPGWACCTSTCSTTPRWARRRCPTRSRRRCAPRSTARSSPPAASTTAARKRRWSTRRPIWSPSAGRSWPTPDLVERMKKDAPMNAVNFDKAYTPGAEGYTDYPDAGLKPSLGTATPGRGACTPTPGYVRMARSMHRHAVPHRLPHRMNVFLRAAIALAATSLSLQAIAADAPVPAASAASAPPAAGKCEAPTADRAAHHACAVGLARHADAERAAGRNDAALAALVRADQFSPRTCASRWRTRRCS